MILAPGLGYRLHRGGRFVPRVLVGASLVKDAWDEAALRGFAANLAEPERARACVQMYRVFNLRELMPIVRGRYARQRLKVPTRMLFGTGDAALRPELLAGYERHADDMQVELVPDCGHFIADERPELVAERARAFFAPPSRVRSRSFRSARPASVFLPACRACRSVRPRPTPCRPCRPARIRAAGRRRRRGRRRTGCPSFPAARSSLRHRHHALGVGEVGRRLLDDAVAGAAGAGAERVAALDDEVRRDPVEGEVVVEAFFGKEDEGVDGLRRPRKSSAMSNVPQLVFTTAVSFSPFFTVCFGALKLTCFGFGASTCVQPATLASCRVADRRCARSGSRRRRRRRSARTRPARSTCCDPTSPPPRRNPR